MPRRNTPASPPMTGGLGESWPPNPSGDITLNVFFAVIISSTSCGIPLSSAWRALVETSSLNRAMRIFISSWLGVFVFTGVALDPGCRRTSRGRIGTSRHNGRYGKSCTREAQPVKRGGARRAQAPRRCSSLFDIPEEFSANLKKEREMWPAQSAASESTPSPKDGRNSPRPGPFTDRKINSPARRSSVLEAVLNGAHRSYVYLAPPSHPSTGRIGARSLTTAASIPAAYASRRCPARSSRVAA